MKNNRQLGIYIHIPFCVRKCDYCDFLSGLADDSVKSSYIEALKCEIAHTAEMVKNRNCQADTIFFGGGTPTAVNAEYIAQILGEIREYFDVSPSAEITIECNPGTLTREKADIYRNAGINRISFGLQSADDRLLKLIGRIHTWEDFKQSMEIAREAGFDNINVDIMSALPGQTLSGYICGLERVLEYEPEHISAYSLILEEGTPLGDNPSNYPPVPDEDTEREMYYETLRILEKYGYHRYEISNYSKPGCECRHNLSYWDRKNYLGFGVGAASLFDEKRMSNIRSVDEYIRLMGCSKDSARSKKCSGCTAGRAANAAGTAANAAGTAVNAAGTAANAAGTAANAADYAYSIESRLRSEVEILSRESAMSEFMFLGLRKTAGISFSDFAEQFGEDICGIFGAAIEENVSKGLLEYVCSDAGGSFKNGCMPDGCRLTDRGTDVSNVVLADFLL